MDKLIDVLGSKLYATGYNRFVSGFPCKVQGGTHCFATTPWLRSQGVTHMGQENVES